MVPPFDGVTLNVTRYWVFQVQAIVEGALIAKVTADELPEAGILPVPDQPVQTYCVPVPPDTGEATKSVMLVPLSYHPFVGEAVA